MAQEKPKPTSKPVVKPTTKPVSGDDDFDDDVSQWLEKANEDDFSKRREDPNTRRFRLDSTGEPSPESETPPAGETDECKRTRKTPLTASNSKDSTDAAVDGLRRMFGRK